VVWASLPSAAAEQRANVASARTLPRVVRFVRQAFKCSVVGFLVSLLLLRVGLIRFLLVLLMPAAEATHALRVGIDRRQSDG
jgi:hypothetical protein